MTDLRVQDVESKDFFENYYFISKSLCGVTICSIAEVNLRDITRNYINLRPQDTKYERFFF